MVRTWAHSEKAIAEYIKPGYWHNSSFSIGSGEYALVLRHGALKGEVVSKGVVKRPWRDFFGRTSFIFLDGRQKETTINVSAIPTDHLEVNAQLDLKYRADPEIAKHLVGMLLEKRQFTEDDFCSKIVSGLEGLVRGMARQKSAAEMKVVTSLQNLYHLCVAQGVRIDDCTVRWSYTQDALTKATEKSEELKRRAMTATTQTEIESMRVEQARIIEGIKICELSGELERNKQPADPERIKREEAALQMLRLQKEKDNATLEKEEKELDMAMGKAERWFAGKNSGKNPGSFVYGGKFNNGPDKQKEEKQ